LSELIDRVEKLECQAEEDIRLDKFLVEQLPEFSRSRLQALISESKVTVNQKIITKSGYILAYDDLVEVAIPPVKDIGLVPEDIPLDIIFENSDLLIVNKPAGMVVHPAVGHSSGTLVNAVLGYDPELEGIGGEERPGIVHRLDKDTSGLIVVAKNDQSLRWLQEQFRLRLTEKIYLALVDGKPGTPVGRVEAPIGRDQTDRKKMSVTNLKKGREAVSEYKTMESFKNHTLLEFHPLTGRTHQIRLHCRLLGCPIVGDMVYGHKKASIAIGRHFLHAYKLKITLPGETSPREFVAPLPEELQIALEVLRNA
jgi:23S rRNA pseudouridine1911/1915/1917 synthase